MVFPTNVGNNSVMVVNETELEDGIKILKERLGGTRMMGFDCEWVDRENWLKFYAKQTAGYACLPANYTEDMERIRMQNSDACRVSLVQMASYDGFAILVRLVFFETFPIALKDLLEDGSVVKVGVNIQEDCYRLYNDWNVVVNGWIDLRNVYTEIPNLLRDNNGGGLSLLNKTGLKALGAKYIPDFVNFEQGDRFQNWNRPTFTPNQIRYAEQDARIAVKALAVMAERHLDLNLTKKDAGSSRFWRHLFDHVTPYVNRPFDMERYQKREAKRKHETTKKTARKEQEDDSSSDVEINWNADVCTTAAGAKIFCSKDGEPAVAVSSELVEMCGRVGSLEPMLAKFETGDKRYIVKVSLTKVCRHGDEES